MTTTTKATKMTMTTMMTRHYEDSSPPPPPPPHHHHPPPRQHRRWILVLLTVALLCISSYTSHMLQLQSSSSSSSPVFVVWSSWRTNAKEEPEEFWRTNSFQHNRSSSWEDYDGDERQPMTSSSSMSSRSSSSLEQHKQHITRQSDEKIQQQQQQQSEKKDFAAISTSKQDDDDDDNAGSIKLQQQEKEQPQQSEIAWLMSFGGSGTSYTIINVEAMTNTSTATNYAESLSQCIPIRPHYYQDGPCLHHYFDNNNTSTSNSPLSPSRFVLTKTHCGGYCMDCAPRDFLHNTTSFERACRTGSRQSANSPNVTSADTITSNTTTTISIPVIVEPFIYADDVVPQKVVHLIRSPFDNIIGRMHLAVKRRKQKHQQQLQQGQRVAFNDRAAVQDQDQAAITAQFVDSSEGLTAWCRHLDEKYQPYTYYSSQELHNVNAKNHNSNASSSPLSLLLWSLNKYGTTVPCHMEWFRYIQWHNHAVEITNNMMMQQQRHIDASVADPVVYYLYYENYTLQYNETVHELLHFLQLDAVASPKPFKPGKSYLNFFDVKHIQAATRMVQDLSLPATWNLIRHYFNHDSITTSSSSSSLQQLPQLNQMKDNNSATTTRNGDINTIDYKPDVVWLMSFPNSGTSYTISNTERVTNFSTASNYAGDWKDYAPPTDQAPHLGYNGPFVHKPALGLAPTSLLTKTHCGGYCDDCRPSGYVIESAQAFQDACCLGERMLPNGNRTNVSYSANVVQKIVHLVRNPFDNLIARLHLAVKRRKRMSSGGGWDEKTLAEFSHASRDSYLAWCNYVDSRHAKALQETKLISSNVKTLMKGLPCHADWFRYVQWHNRAIQVSTEQLQVPVHYLFYENYSTNYNETLHELLEFLNLLPAVNEPLPFQPGKTYMSMYYSTEEIQAATRFVRATATPACWNLLKRYF